MSALPAICRAFEKPFCGKKTTTAVKQKNPSKTQKPQDSKKTRVTINKP